LLKEEDERYMYVDNLFVHLLQSNDLVSPQFLNQRKQAQTQSTNSNITSPKFVDFSILSNSHHFPQFVPPSNAHANRTQLSKVHSISRDKLSCFQQFDWECLVVTDIEKITGFSTPGGKIVLSTGLIDKLVTKDEDCAAVLCHEIAHVLCRHVVEGWQRTLGWQLLISAILLGLGLDLSGGIDTILEKLVLFGGQLPMQRRMELEADEVAIYLMLSAGYDPSALVHTLEKISEIEKKSPQPPQFMLTHPSSDSRKQELEKKNCKNIVRFKTTQYSLSNKITFF